MVARVLVVGLGLVKLRALMGLGLVGHLGFGLG